MSHVSFHGLSYAWRRKAAGVQNVAAVRQQEGTLVFTDIMGVQTRVEAVLDRMDLMENFIFIKDAKA